MTCAGRHAMPTNRRRGTPPQRPNAATAPGAPTSPATGSTQRSAGPTQPVTGEVAPEQQAQGALARRRLLLSWMSVGLSGLAGAVVSVPILAYLLSPLLRAAPPEWIDVDDVSKFAIGQTVLRSIVEFSPLPWAGQTAQTAI